LLGDINNNKKECAQISKKKKKKKKRIEFDSFQRTTHIGSEQPRKATRRDDFVSFLSYSQDNREGYSLMWNCLFLWQPNSNERERARDERCLLLVVAVSFLFG
jgi:hypothetical protein